MKKTEIRALLIAVGILCVGCNINTIGNSESNVGNQQSESAEEMPNTEQENRTEESVFDEDPWEITIQKDNQNFYAEDGTRILSYGYDRLTITNKSDMEAAQKVMTTLEQEDQTPDQWLTYANEDYDSFIKDGATEGFRMHYFMKEYRFSEINGYLSIICSEETSSGGSHSNGETHAYVFAPDGTRLYLNDLFEDSDLARTAVITALQPEIEDMSENDTEEKEKYEKVFADCFSDGEAGNDTQCWYLDEDGIVLLAQPYTLGGYTSNAISFYISDEAVDNWKLPVYQRGEQ